MERKGWTLSWMALCFTGLSVTHVIGSLGAGPLVDRIGAPRLLPFFLAPLGLGLLVLALGNHPAAAAGYLILSGLTAGAGGTIAGALWAEAYGTVHLEAVRSMTGAIFILSTAASPVSMGWILDRGVRVESIAGGCVVYVVVAALLTVRAYRHETRRARDRGGGHLAVRFAPSRQ